MHHLLGIIRISADGDWKLAYADQVKHIELSGEEMELAPGDGRFNFNRERILCCPPHASTPQGSGTMGCAGTATVGPSGIDFIDV